MKDVDGPVGLYTRHPPIPHARCVFRSVLDLSKHRAMAALQTHVRCARICEQGPAHVGQASGVLSASAALMSGPTRVGQET